MLQEVDKRVREEGVEVCYGLRRSHDFLHRFRVTKVGCVGGEMKLLLMVNDMYMVLHDGCCESLCGIF
jgi:hypothetical protein